MPDREFPYARMLGIATAHVIDGGYTPLDPPADATRGALGLAYNQTEPMLLRDGIDRITVVPLAPDEYLVNYTGYARGHLRVTEFGIAQFGSEFLHNRPRVPYWLIDERPASGVLPWWVPDTYEEPATVSCDECGTDVPVSDVVTPRSFPGPREHLLCPDCWNREREWSGVFHPESE